MPIEATTARPDAIRDLVERVRRVEERSPEGRDGGSEPRRPVPTGWAGVDTALRGGLARGAVHEWFASEDRPASPPLAVLAWLARRALGAPPSGEGRAEDAAGAGLVVWVGLTPGPGALTLDGEADPGAARPLLERSVLVAARDAGERLWAMDLAARCPAVAVVVGDGRALDMAATRRLALAARAGGGLCLLARPREEAGSLSASATRWLVRASPGGDRPRFELTLTRRKGGVGASAGSGVGARRPEGPLRWTVEHDRAQGLVAAHADLVDRPGRSRGAPRFRRASA